MTSTQATQTSQPGRGRPPALDAQQKKRIVALLDIGCSRRTAARCIGCSPSTITRTAARDPEFSDEIARAETNLEVQLLQQIRRAASSEKYWRAASWLLERKFPADYIPQPPRLYSADQVMQLFAATINTLRGELTSDQMCRAVQKLGDLLLECEGAAPQSSPPEPKPAQAPT